MKVNDSIATGSVALATVVLSVLLSSCSKGGESSVISESASRVTPETTPFYEYQGGVINLNHVSHISTFATLSLSVAPRMRRGHHGSYEQAIYEAHDKYCLQWKPDAEYLGDIPRAQIALVEIAVDIAKDISPEFLNTCALKIEARATVMLDDYWIVQQPGSFVLPRTIGEFENTGEFRARVKSLILRNVNQPAEWERKYGDLQRRFLSLRDGR